MPPLQKIKIKRSSHITCSSVDNRHVFQIVKPFRDVSLADVQDSLDASHKLSLADKQTYMYSHGIDMDRVTKYFDIVQNLEKQMKTKTAFEY